MSYSSPIRDTRAPGTAANPAAHIAAPKDFPIVKAPRSAMNRARPPGRAMKPTLFLVPSIKRTLRPLGSSCPVRTKPSEAAHTSRWCSHGATESRYRGSMNFSQMRSRKSVRSSSRVSLSTREPISVLEVRCDNRRRGDGLQLVALQRVHELRETIGLTSGACTFLLQRLACGVQLLPVLRG